MKKYLVFFLLSAISIHGQGFSKETKEQREARMQWWREARFGLFIHWGLYAIPAGEWNGEKDHAEWIRQTAEIPLQEYEKFVSQFNPVKFDAEEWVRLAKEAGMKYIVITSKHHDGFCLFDSKHTDFDVMSTPFKRDILKELAEACRKEGIKMCWYHSIMDWHHPDYLPRRPWEKDRPTEGANLDRFGDYLKNQLKELVTNYGDIGVLWFDGEWEDTWTTEHGNDLYDYVRSLDPKIIVNNRVSKGRAGLEGYTKEGEFAGDFGTPEQQIPATGLPGVDWESCMTMNDHWGYNKNDKNWKSTKALLQNLADIASKGGNFLLNVGPTAEGVFPRESIERLREIGAWMKINGESIYGTQASRFKKLDWGRCTQKPIDGGTKLYLHVFDWPQDGKLVISGISNQGKQAWLLSDANKKKLSIRRNEDALVIDVPVQAPDENNSVVVLDVSGKPNLFSPPVIAGEQDIFVNTLDVPISSEYEEVEIRYTLDGSTPSSTSPIVDKPIRLTNTTVVSARLFKNGMPLSAALKATFTKVKPLPATNVDDIQNGVKYKYFEGTWNHLPDFGTMKALEEGVLSEISLSPRKRNDLYGFEFSGYIKIPAEGVYSFYTESDDGSRLYIGEQIVVDNDGLHPMVEKHGLIALAAGLHPIRVIFFEKNGGDDLNVFYKGEEKAKERIPGSILFLGKVAAK
jgi:alpha-L-fucosidase